MSGTLLVAVLLLTLAAAAHQLRKQETVPVEQAARGNEDSVWISPAVLRRHSVEKLVLPEYPAEAVASRTQGTVVVELVVPPSGRATEVRAMSGPTSLRSSAEAAAWKCEFRPSLLNGIPVTIRSQLHFRFTLSRHKRSRARVVALYPGA